MNHYPKAFRAVLLVVLAAGAGCATNGSNVPTRAVEQLDVDSYLGTWFEIAKYPQWFQRGCTCTTATYDLLDNGDIRVLNRCRDDSPAGELREAKGRATRPSPQEEPAKLRVSFFGPFSAPYWVIARGEPEDGRYPWAVVSDDDGGTLWILSRTPTLEEHTYSALLADLGAQGFDLSRLDQTVQQGCWEQNEELASGAEAGS